MTRTNLHRHLLVNAGAAVAQPPPVGDSGSAFVTTFLLTSMGIVLALALIVTAPLTVTLPLGIVAAGYALATATAAVIVRRGARPKRGVRPTVVPTSWGVLGGLSVVLLALALFAPERPGSLLAALGFVGLFTFRVMAMREGWIRRRSASGPATAGSAR